jgi:hypothetical protein
MFQKHDGTHSSGKEMTNNLGDEDGEGYGTDSRDV